MKVLFSSASFSPSYGGPAYSVRTLADAVADSGVATAIWAPDGSAKMAEADEAESRKGGRALALGGSLADALREFGDPDILHDSGLWWRHNREIASRARTRGVPLVVSVRGMLEPWALRHHAWRKRVAWRLYQKAILDSAAALHVTSELEAQRVHDLQLRPRIACIPNGLAVPRVPPDREVGRRKLIVFMGRLHPIKGLPMLLKAWTRLHPVDWALEIAGPDEGGHRKDLEKIVRGLGLESAVVFSGPVRGSGKADLLARASVLVLPSHSENFGLAAGEALAQGLPVIASKGTPWAALETEGCGWYVEASMEGLAEGLSKVFATPPAELAVMGRRGHAYVSRAFLWQRIATDMIELYDTIARRSS